MSGIRLSQFYGIEIDDFAHEVAQLSLWLAEHQMNALFNEEFGSSEPTLPLSDSANLVLGNSVRLDWQSVCPVVESVEVYVCGNPPFSGRGSSRTKSQLDDMAYLFGGLKSYKKIDYVSCWFFKGVKYIGEHAELSFVSTNSICQGEQVEILWPLLLGEGVSISVAYQTFPWKNNAAGNAGVHVVIVGLSKFPSTKRLYRRVNGAWHIQEVENISPYLLEGGDAVVSARSDSLCGFPKMLFGSMARDGGHLHLTTQEKEQIVKSYPICETLIRPLVGADEFLNGKERWCFWLDGCSLDYLRKIPPIARRLESVSEMRKASKALSTRDYANRPHLFVQNAQPKDGSYILVPAFTSERRPYVPLDIMDSSVVSNNKNYMIPNGGIYEFSVLSSTMHMDWMRLVCGRLKSDYGYSTSLVYNTFPWPDASDRQRQDIEQLGREVILARAAHPDKTMAQLYDPDKMPENLLEAHQALDRAVEKLYRDRPFRDTAERQEYLLARYEELIEAEKAAKVGESRKSRSAATTEGPYAST